MKTKKYYVRTAKGYITKDKDVYSEDRDEAEEMDEGDAKDKAKEEEGEVEEAPDKEGKEGEEEEEEIAEERKPKKPFFMKPSMKTLATLHAASMDEDDYIRKALDEMDHDGVRGDLEKIHKKHVVPRRGAYLEALHRHHGGDSGMEPDELMDKCMKSLEADEQERPGFGAEPGEAGEVAQGRIPPEDEDLEVDEEDARSHPASERTDSMPGSREWEEEERHEPAHKPRRGGPDTTEPDVTEVSDRYNESPDEEEVFMREEDRNKGWITRKVGVVRRGLNGKLYWMANQVRKSNGKSESTVVVHPPGFPNPEDRKPAPYNKALNDADVESVKDASEYLKDMSEDEEEVPKGYRIASKAHGRRLGQVHKALTEMGKVQYDGGRGSELSDEGKVQHDGGKGSELSDEGEVQTSEGTPTTEIISGSGKPLWGGAPGEKNPTGRSGTEGKSLQPWEAELLNAGRGLHEKMKQVGMIPGNGDK